MGATLQASCLSVWSSLGCRMSIPNHFSSALVSNFQSAVAKVSSRSTADMMSLTQVGLSAPPVNLDDPMVRAAASAGDAEVKAMLGHAPPAAVNAMEKCARAAMAVAKDRVAGKADAAIVDGAILKPFGGCDPRWAECITEFVAHYKVAQHTDVPYKRWRSLSDFVLPDPSVVTAPEVLAAQCTIGVIGDWGTNEPRSQALLLKLAENNIDLLIHLGDIYYSCTAIEASAFHDNIVKAFAGRKMPRVFTLCGNHDMYSGGAPYYALLGQFGQPASFFCLRNAHWQILAMDTGYNDFDPNNVDSGETWVQNNDDPHDPYSELDWHIDKLKNVGADRRTILLSHHQPFRLNNPIGGSHAVNHRLIDPFMPYFDQVAIWLWGHEHNQTIFRPFLGLQKGRCVGASAIPIAATDDVYGMSGKFKNADGTPNQPVPDWFNLQLAVDPTNALYNLGYAVVKLDGNAASAEYYQYDSSQNRSTLMLTEAL